MGSIKYLCVILLRFSVLDLDAFERCNKAEGLGMGDGSSAQTKNLQDVDTTCKIFRLLQLLCEGHNLGKDYGGLDFVFILKGLAL